MSQSSPQGHGPIEPQPPIAAMAGASTPFVPQSWAEESKHNLTSPGAYEWWYFQALSSAGDGILLTLFEGLPFHPRYLTNIRRYGRAHATTRTGKARPALQSSRYPAAYLAVYEGGKRVAQFLNVYPPDTTTAGGADTPDIRIGPNRITLCHDGSFGISVKGYPYTISHGRPKRRPDQFLTASLTFTPTTPGVQHMRPFRAPDASGAQHYWVLAAPHGRMTGTVRLLDTRTNETVIGLDVDTLGYHDHVYGQGGLSTGIDTLLWGFLQGETWTAAWHQTIASASARDRADGLVFFEEGHLPVVIDFPDSRLSKPHFSNWFLRHPGRISMHGSDAHGHPLELLLTHTAVLDTAPFHTRLAAKGTLTIPGRGQGISYIGRGTTHILKLRRLRWPILSDLTLIAITPISRDDPIWNE